MRAHHHTRSVGGRLYMRHQFHGSDEGPARSTHLGKPPASGRCPAASTEPMRMTTFEGERISPSQPRWASRSSSISDWGTFGMSSRTRCSTAAKSSATPRCTACLKMSTGSRSPTTAPGMTSPAGSCSSPPCIGRYMCSSARKDAKTAGDPSWNTRSQSCATAASGQEWEARDRKCSEANTSSGTSRWSRHAQTPAGRTPSRRASASSTAASRR
mmetsp:Transcript_60343/g.179712  ORF Transcript_60343/g.179712 Transcript_60343/m.179712 type:complete len:214 (+) Transcript_60343:79-720(+)